MIMFEPNNSVVVFDLDDTLYLERDYVISGIGAISRFVSELYSRDIQIDLLAYYHAGGTDFIGEACNLAGLPIQAKESLLWVYRMHSPTISLVSYARSFIDQLSLHSVPMAIITDGRSISQRQKIKALGLDRIKVYISEEWQSEKPDLMRFNEVMNCYPHKSYIYIADNPSKDFYAPKQLGWKSFQMKNNNNFIHSILGSDLEHVSGDLLVSDFEEISSYFMWNKQ